MPADRPHASKALGLVGRRAGPALKKYALALAGNSMLMGSAMAQTVDDRSLPGIPLTFGLQVGTFEVVQLAVFAGALIAAFVSAGWLIKERGRIAGQNAALRGKLSATSARLAQLEALATIEGQKAIIWSSGTSGPITFGTLDSQAGAPDRTSDFLAFGRWLTPQSAARLSQEIAELRRNATPFGITVETKAGTFLDATGRTAVGTAVIRFSNLSKVREELAHMEVDRKRITDTLTTIQALLDRIDIPFWLRGADGRLTWTNRAFASSVDCAGNDEVITKQSELFGAQAREKIRDGLAQEGFDGDLSTVVSGDRVIFQVTEAKGPFGSAGHAVDRSETEAVREELSTTIRSHEETLNELTTAVAMFDVNATMLFYNNAFQDLWELDAHYLASNPTMAMFLDRMREQGQLPEMPEWRRWKQDVLDSFKAIEPQSHLWHLPDRRTVRVFANPHPRGGMTWIFENLTERINLESQYKTMQRVQGQTLDHLAEGVAVFASDGYLKLANPAFGKFWGVLHLLDGDPMHVRDIIEHRRNADDDTAELWEEMAGVVTDFAEDRINLTGRTQVSDKTLSWMVVPLPNGQTMLTFVDMSAAEQVERALRERNEALEQTAELRSRFIKHVSHELRAPLTTIKGFTDMLLLGTVGALSESQSEYVNHISAASGTLVNITDAILDLASIDAGIFELKPEQTVPADIMSLAADQIRPRLEEHDVKLKLDVKKAPDMIVADPARLQQVFENILNNAADFAPNGSIVTFSCRGVDEAVEFVIADEGPGLVSDDTNQLFEPFHTEQAGRRRGAGLGLALVRSLINLHGGLVSIEARDNGGTRVVLSLPTVPAKLSVAAE
ncbi:MAG: ATP-binding protein [Pseudomonadota bacterium]